MLNVVIGLSLFLGWFAFLMNTRAEDFRHTGSIVTAAVVSMIGSLLLIVLGLP